MTAYYGKDLAFVHAEGFGDFAREAAPGLLALLKRAGVARGKVVELGCGAGAATRHLARAGHDVLGLDASRDLLRHARRSVARAEFVFGRLPRVSLPACDAVVAVGEVLNYMAKPSDFGTLFAKARRALRPGGVLIFDARLRGGASAPVTRGKYSSDWAVLATSSEDARGRLTRRIVSFVPAGGVWRRSEETHRLTLLSAARIGKALKSAGFRSVEELPGYGNFRVPDGHAVFVARR